jgi:predicted RNA binding protein YcfA (HicA-like mRNA interferase family)
LRAFEQQGWFFRRQAGSHMILTKAGSIVSLSIPDHRELAPLRKLIRLAGIDVDEFRASLK